MRCVAGSGNAGELSQGLSMRLSITAAICASALDLVCPAQSVALCCFLLERKWLEAAAQVSLWSQRALND
jgi:hypothetical protein